MLPERVPCVPPRHTTVALGFFDGVHVAHAEVLRRAAALATPEAPFLVFTFSESDSPKGGALLSDDGERAALFAAAGARYAVFACFSELCALPPDAFIRDVLGGALGARTCVVGEDFRFGAGAAGSAHTLAAGMAALGGRVEVLSSLRMGGEKISSSRIRLALASGDCEGAAALLGRPYALTLPVVAGQRLGRRLGFPTANQCPPRHRALPARGVYITEVTLPTGERRHAVTNVGIRPTVGGEGLLIESHIPGFSGDLYGKPVRLAFLSRLRGEEHFSSTEALALRILEDCKEITRWKERTGLS